MMMMMDVIFAVSIDPTISTASFANLKNISCTVSNRLVYNGKRSVQYPSEKKMYTLFYTPRKNTECTVYTLVSNLTLCF